VKPALGYDLLISLWKKAIDFASMENADKSDDTIVYDQTKAIIT